MMENFSMIIQLAVLLLPTLLLCILTPLFLLMNRRTTQQPLLPPGPRPLPVIGHLHLLGTQPHRSLHELSKTYGPLMSLKLGSARVVVASSASAAKQILQTHDQNFAFRVPTATAMELHRCNDILFSQPGAYWKLMRQLCVTDLLSNKRLEFFRPLIVEEVKSLLSSIYEECVNVGVTLRTKLHETTNNIISRMTLGRRLSDSTSNSPNDFVETMVEAIDLLGAINLSDYFPFLAWMDLQGCRRRMKPISTKLHKIMQEIIDDRRKRRADCSNGHVDTDFLDVLLSAAESQHQSMEIPDYNIRAVLMDVFAAGTDTSVVTTEWALAELLANPTKLANVKQELQDVVGTTRLVEMTDLPNLPYLQAVVKETMRLHPVLPLLVPHKAGKSCEVLGFSIPPDSQAYINTWAIGRDPSIWPNPFEFSPERFLNSNVDVHGHHFEFLPFGSGRRICPGWPLGLLNVQFLLASLLHTFDWTTSSKPDLSEVFGIVMTLATPLVATSSPRISEKLFRIS